jgi:hypothetical protein
MSVDALKEYGRRCATDPALARRAKEIGIDNVQGQIEHARSLGLNWTTDDMAALARETGAGAELSEAQLERVAGGIVTTTAALAVAAVAASAAAVVGAGVGVTQTVQAGGW